jgi:DNA-binding winged helix-turn-helix (wHTH) protein
MTLASPRAAKLFQLGHLRFHSGDGTVTGAGVAVQLTPKETDLLSVFCAHSDRFLSAREAFELAWDEPQAKEWRARFDTQLANLRDKLGPHLPDLIENTRSRGYRLNVTCGPRDAPSQDAAEEEPKEISFASLLRRVTLRDHGGVLEPHSMVIVVSAHPIELLHGAEPGPIANILAGNVSYVYLVPADALPIVAELVRMVAQAIAATLSNDPAPALPLDPLEDQATVRDVTKRLRIVLTSPPCLDSFYVLNAQDQHLAEVYYCLHQDRRALRVKDRSLAREHARELLRLVPIGNGVIQFAPGLPDRQATEDALRAELVDWLGPDHLGWIKLVLPDSPQNPLPVAKPSKRKPPASASRIEPHGNLDAGQRSTG